MIRSLFKGAPVKPVKAELSWWFYSLFLSLFGLTDSFKIGYQLHLKPDWWWMSGSRIVCVLSLWVTVQSRNPECCLGCELAWWIRWNYSKKLPPVSVGSSSPADVGGCVCMRVCVRRPSSGMLRFRPEEKSSLVSLQVSTGRSEVSALLLWWNWQHFLEQSKLSLPACLHGSPDKR